MGLTDEKSNGTIALVDDSEDPGANVSNIQLQQNKLSLEEADVDVKSAKASLFPSLSFSTGHNLVNRPYQETSATVSGTEIITSNSNIK